MFKNRHAFTLIELLVVISIIALLISILLPALSQARVAVREVQCKANLQQFGVGVTGHSADSKGFIMTSYEREPGWQDPSVIGKRDDKANAFTEWNVETLGEYIPQFSGHTDADNTDAKGFGILVCPSVDPNFGERFVTSWFTSTVPFTQIFYSYYGGVDRWNPALLHNGAENELPTSKLEEPGRTLMSDTFLYAGYFRYNHGRGSQWSWNYPPANAGYNDPGPAPNMKGNNKLSSDMSVQMKSIDEFEDPQMLGSSSYPHAWAGRAGSPRYW